MDLIGPLYCKVCCVAIPHENVRDKHNQGRRHQLAVHASLTDDNEYKTSVFSVGWPNAIKKEEILNFMEKYGTVKSHYMSPKQTWMITKYDDINVAQSVIQMGKINFHGKRITFSAKKRNEVQPQPLPQEESNYEPILKVIANQSSFGAEIIALSNILQPNIELDIKRYLHLCADLELSLQTLYPNAKVHPFGSTITGLAFRDSDVDAFIFVPHPRRYNNKCFYVEAVNETRDFLVHSPLFNNIMSIPRAKTPIVKCVHVPTGLKCDFNFKNMLGVCNSYFIQFVVRLDPKLKLSLLVLKFWSKTRMVGGTNSRITNYALAMLFIYYLQQAPYNLPPIVKMQENPAVCNIQHGWNGGFDPNYPIELSAIRNASMHELLYGYFKFYLNLKYDDIVISPYLGKTIPRTCFASLDTLPEIFQQYRVSFRDEHLKVGSLLCIQDPFEHNRNLTGSLGRKFVDEYLNELKRALETLDAQKSHLLYQLCTDSYDNITQYMFRAKMPKMKSLQFLFESMDSASDSPTYEFKLAWFRMVDKFLIEILTDVFKFTVNVNKDDDSHENPKKMKPDILTNLYNTTYITASGMYNTWDVRNVLKDVQFTTGCNTFLQRQVEISQYIQEHLLKDVVMKKSIIDFNIKVEHYILDTHVFFTLENSDNPVERDCNYFGSFASYFSKTFPTWLVLYCKENNQPYFVTEVSDDVQTNSIVKTDQTPEST